MTDKAAETKGGKKIPPQGTSPHETGHEHGIPDGATEAEAKGTPNSDRHQTETAPKK